MYYYLMFDLHRCTKKMSVGHQVYIWTCIQMSYDSTGSRYYLKSKYMQFISYPRILLQPLILKIRLISICCTHTCKSKFLFLSCSAYMWRIWNANLWLYDAAKELPCHLYLVNVPDTYHLWSFYIFYLKIVLAQLVVLL